MSKLQFNQHDFCIIAQCKNPYREFAYCERCGKYRENGSRQHTLISKKLFYAIAISLKDSNPLYEPDSDRLLELPKF